MNSSPINVNSGESITTSILQKVKHFALNINGMPGGAASGNTGSNASCQLYWTVPGGNGGPGLYIIAKHFIFTGSIDLSGNNGMYAQINGPNIFSAGGGGGGGSAIISFASSENIGTFTSLGGQNLRNNERAGSGAILFIQR